MKSITLCAIALSPLAVSVPVVGQAFSSPAGLLATEASEDHGHVLGSIDGLRWQQVDGTHRGTARPNIASISWRRDAALASNFAYGNRTFHQMTVVMGHASPGRLSADLDANYQDAPVIVFGPQDVTTPDWAPQPVTSPAPFDLTIPFDVTWNYNGVDDLLWEVRYQSVTPTPFGLRNFPYDFQPDAGDLAETQLGGTFLSVGCIADGQTSRRFVLGAEFANHGGEFRLAHSANFGPQNGAISTFLGFTDPNVLVPGLCARLRCDPLVTLALGVGSATGCVPAVTHEFPHSPVLIGQPLYLQSLALDATQSGIPLALTQGVRLTVPVDPSPVLVAHAYGYTTASGAAFQTTHPGGVVARFGL